MSNYTSQTICSFTSKVSQGLHYLTLGFNASYHDVQSRSSPGVALVCTWSKASGERRCTQIASRLKYAITYRVKKIFTEIYIQSGDTIINRSVVSSHIFMKYLYLRFLPIIYFTSKINLHFGFSIQHNQLPGRSHDTLSDLPDQSIDQLVR